MVSNIFYVLAYYIKHCWKIRHKMRFLSAQSICASICSSNTQLTRCLLIFSMQFMFDDVDTAEVSSADSPDCSG